MNQFLNHFPIYILVAASSIHLKNQSEYCINQIWTPT